ncbi:KpsF/GutQ family sugar-phosphate isomerase [Novipirellula rosea]|uniref:KpsF/GutQ family sugar-phosphate isomerase n=1 Tax=Novipirellula rosea TaxID=1031540 RepID=A0ABP8M4B2_9BACT
MSAAEKLPIATTSVDTSVSLPETLIERLRILREIVSIEGHAILSAANTLGSDAVRAAEMTAQCEGSVMVTGVGKAGLVGKKLVATLASTGTPAHFLHPAEAVHGDLGRVRPHDLVWAISNSGRSEEVVRIAPHLREHSAGLIAITASTDNPLSAAATCTVAIGKHNEACPNGLAPTSSTAVMMAVGDGIAMLASRLRSFTPQDFAKFHPGGALGRKLATVDQIMRGLDACRIATSDITVREAMVRASKNGRRTGAVMLVNESKQLVGIFTDSDLARILETRNDIALDESIANRMTANPTTASSGMLLQDALAIMSRRRISELPVLDAHRRPIGLIDITDIAGMLGPQDEPAILSFKQ